MAAEGYLWRVLADGARPFGYRGSVRSLLGQPHTASVALRAAAPVPPATLSYARLGWIGEIELPDELFTGTQPPPGVPTRRAGSDQETWTGAGARHPAGPGASGHRREHGNEDGDITGSPSRSVRDQMFPAPAGEKRAEHGPGTDHRPGNEHQPTATKPVSAASAGRPAEAGSLAGFDPPPAAHGSSGGNVIRELHIPGRTNRRAPAADESTRPASVPSGPAVTARYQDQRGEPPRDSPGEPPRTAAEPPRGAPDHPPRVASAEPPRRACTEPPRMDDVTGGAMPVPRQTVARAPARPSGEVSEPCGTAGQEDAPKSSRPSLPLLTRRPGAGSRADTGPAAPAAEALPPQWPAARGGALGWAELAATTASAAQRAEYAAPRRERDVGPGAEPAQLPPAPAAVPAPQLTVVLPSRPLETRPAFWERRHLGRLWSRPLR